MRHSFFAIATVASLGMFACVGDDPTTTPTPSDGGAADATATDAGPADAGPSDAAPTDAGPTDAGPKPPFSPTALPAIALWLDASNVTLANGKIATWSDSSGVQPTPIRLLPVTSSTLTFTAPTPDSVLAGGGRVTVPTVRFTQTTQTFQAMVLQSAGDRLDFGTGDLAAEVVVSVSDTNSANLGAVLLKNKVVSPFDGLQLYANYPNVVRGNDLHGMVGGGLGGENSSNLKPTANDAVATHDGKLHLIGFRRVAGRVSLRYDGKEVASATPSANAVVNATNALPFYVGGSPTGQHAVSMEIADIVILKGEHTDAELNALETFLTVKDKL
jgi:hypothetical protein